MPFDKNTAMKEIWKARLGVGVEGASEKIREEALKDKTWRSSERQNLAGLDYVQ